MFLTQKTTEWADTWSPYPSATSFPTQSTVSSTFCNFHSIRQVIDWFVSCLYERILSWGKGAYLNPFFSHSLMHGCLQIQNEFTYLRTKKISQPKSIFSNTYAAKLALSMLR